MNFQATHVYVGRSLPDRQYHLCRRTTTWRRKGPHNVTIEFEDGFSCITSGRCVRIFRECDRKDIQLIRERKRN